MHNSHAWMRRTIGLFLDKLFFLGLMSLRSCNPQLLMWGRFASILLGECDEENPIRGYDHEWRGVQYFLWSFRKFSPFLSTEWVSVYVLVVCIPIYSCQVLFTALTNQISLAQNEIHLVNGRLNEWKPFWIPGTVPFPVLQVQCFTKSRTQLQFDHSNKKCSSCQFAPYPREYLLSRH